MAESMDKWKASATSNDGAMKKVADVIEPGISTDKVQHIYSEWKDNYEHDMGMLVYNAPEIVADHLADYLGDRKDAKIVDACAGTGRTAMQLHKRGFTNITALDGNVQMLEEAKKKNIYNDTICAWMGNVRLPIPDNTFDGLCASGAFYEGHLKPDCLPEFIRIVKPGGFIVFGIPEVNLIIVEAFRNKIEPDMKFYEDKGLWKMMLRKVVPDYLQGLGNGVIYCFVPQEGKKVLATA